MTIEPVAELGGGGASGLPRARVVPLTASPSSYTAAAQCDESPGPVLGGTAGAFTGRGLLQRGI
ncbi:hypothetical protein GCM10023086_74820 [Streptomyces venetus]|uniref:Uncharacterized protein n=1 Tax=Streptomyces venetus TaxID=1701086 RepID=A0ABP8HI40_9ACTN